MTATAENINDINDIREKARQKIREEEEAFGAKEPVIKVIDAGQIRSMEFDDDPVIDGLLGEKESLVTVGQSGIGKSIITLDMALHLAMPEMGNILGHIMPYSLYGCFSIPKPRTSLFVQSENGMRATSKRLNMILRGEPSLAGGLHRIKMPLIRDDIRITGSLSEQKFKDTLLKLIEEARAEVLFIDPLISYHDADENDNAAMRRTLDCLTVICDETGIAVVVVHHVGKSTTDNGVFSGRGASSIGDWAANILLFTPGQEMKNEDGSRRFTIQCSHRKSRNYETRPDFLLERTRDLLIQRMDAPTDNKDSEKIQTVVSILREHGGYIEKQDDLVNAIMIAGNCSRSTAQRSINSALEHKAINPVPGQGKRVGYKLPDYEPPSESDDSPDSPKQDLGHVADPTGQEETHEA